MFGDIWPLISVVIGIFTIIINYILEIEHISLIITSVVTV